jgi:protein CpxP
MNVFIKRTVIGLFSAAVLAPGLTACGHRTPGFGDNVSAEQSAQHRSKMVERVSGKLDLNPDQKQRLNLLADKLHEQRLAVMGQTTNPRAEISALVAGDKFDKARAQTLVTEKTTAVQAKSPEVIAAMADFYDSLNPAQQQKVRDFMAHRGGWFKRG